MNHNSNSIKLIRIASDYRILLAYDLAQPANKCTPLGMDAFWDKPTPDPPLRWEKWTVEYKLAVLAEENIILDPPLGPKHQMVDLPLEPIYEETIVISSAQSNRERNARNAQQKMNWQNMCQRLIEIGIMCGDKPWPLAEQKRASVLYLGIGVELAENFDFEKKEETLIRDVFIAN